MKQDQDLKIGLTNTDIKKIEIPTRPSDRDLVTSEFEQFIAYAYFYYFPVWKVHYGLLLK